ncbi:hypothetical protein FS837_012250 [Tulasnella sp. UAMH 9824]|nr:hypothetical protein FS837_012250 [Tulasnella sp. UAMH 9824]
MPDSIRLSLPNGRIELSWPPTLEDDPDVHKLYTDSRVVQYLPFWDPNASLESVIQRRTTRLPNLLGTVGFIFMSLENRATEAGIIIHPEAQRAGYASEALYLCLKHGFDSKDEGGLGFNRIMFTTAAMNKAMRGWLENALGAKHEGTLREAWKSGDEFIDAVQYSILAREWFHGGSEQRLRQRVEEAITKSNSQASAS